MKEAIEEFDHWRSFNVGDTTVQGYHQDLRSFQVFIRNEELEAISFQDVLDYLRILKESGIRDNTITRRCIALRKFFGFWKLRGLKVVNPSLIPPGRMQRAQPRVATPEEYYKLLAVIPKNGDPHHIRNRALIQLLWDTGMRNGEACSLDISNVDLENRRALIRTEKGKSRPFRSVYWSKGTNKALQCWLHRREKYLQRRYEVTKQDIADPDAVFISLKNQLTGRRITNRGVAELLRVISMRAGLPRTVNAHSLRHHRGRHLRRKGGDNTDVAQALGHTSLLSTFIYTQLDDPEFEKRYKDNFLD